MKMQVQKNQVPGAGKCKYGKWTRNVRGSIHRWRNYYNWSYSTI